MYRVYNLINAAKTGAKNALGIATRIASAMKQRWGDDEIQGVSLDLDSFDDRRHYLRNWTPGANTNGTANSVISCLDNYCKLFYLTLIRYIYF